VDEEVKKILEAIPPSKQKLILSKVRKIVAQHIKQRNPEFDMEKRINDAVRNNILSEKYAHYLLFSINSIKKDKEYQMEWDIILRRWRDIYYGSKEQKIYFHSELADDVAFGVFRILWKMISNKDEVLRISRRFKNEVKDFLERWRIDGVVDGNPLIDINYYKAQSSLDYVGRPIIIFEIPLIMSVENFRKIIGGEYSKAKKQFYEVAAALRYPRLKWGKRTGKLDYFLERDRKVFEKYLELRPRGMTLDKIYEAIHGELGLEHDMTDIMSLKPIIRRIGKIGKK